MTRSGDDSAMPLDGDAAHFVPAPLVQPIRAAPEILAGRIYFRRAGILPNPVRINRREGGRRDLRFFDVTPRRVLDAVGRLYGRRVAIHAGHAGRIKPGIVSVTTTQRPTEGGI